MKRALLLGCLAVGACGGDDAPVAPPPPSNQPPVATGTPFPQNTSVDVGQSVEVELSTYFSDPDGDALTYAATTTAPDILAVTVTGSVLRMTGAGAGTASVTATARDPGGLSASLTFTGTVETSPDRRALMALYHATGGPDWTESDRWLTDAPLGNWHGVDTDDSGRVVGLDLSYNALAGEIPRELGNLASLRTLRVHDNELTGEIPRELGNLTSLWLLRLDRNALMGEIPPELGNLASLKLLLLDHNDLTGKIPPELGNLARLQQLDLSYNTLAGEIPRELGNLASLLTLRVHYNQLTGKMPPELGNLGSLWLLRLDRNALMGEIPPELGNLARLSELYLNDNALTGEIPATISGLANLEQMDWKLQASLCAPGTQKFIEFADGLEHAEGPFCHETDVAVLESLYSWSGGLSWRSSTGWLQPGPLSNWHGVKTDSVAGRIVALDLSDNGLSGTLPGSLSSLEALRELRIGGNSALGGRLPLGMTALSLRVLRYDGTSLCAPDEPLFRSWLQSIASRTDTEVKCPPLTDRAVLEALYRSVGGPNWNAQDNWLTDSPLEDWYGVDTDDSGQVVGLELRRNGLAGEIPPELGNLARLRTLYLYHNALTGNIPPELGNLARLWDLHLDDNALTGEIPPELGNLARLQRLYLSHNALTGEIPAELGNLADLRTLDLSYNALTGKIPAEVGNLTRLQPLYLSHNALTGEIPPELGDLADLRTLDLSYNALTGEIPPELGNLARLSWLHLSHNAALSGTLPAALTSLKLSQLKLGGTGLCALRDDTAFQSWLRSIPLRRVKVCAELLAGGEATTAAYVVQAIQSFSFPVPLVAGRPGLLRVFVSVPEPKDARAPAARATFYQRDGTERTMEVPSGNGPLSTKLIEGSLQTSANAEVPGEVLRPGVEMVVEVDPGGVLDPGLGVPKRIPATGRTALTVYEMPSFDVTVVPFLWETDPDSSILDVTRDLAPEHMLFEETRRLLPVGAMSVNVHEPVWSSSRNAYDLLEETAAIRTMEGRGGYWMGTLTNPTGAAGRAWIPGRSMFSIPDPSVVAHEFGHNFRLSHAPCGGARGLDPAFPSGRGHIGAWGYDHRYGRLVPPARADLMSYCDPAWIGDYHFANSFRWRLIHEAGVAAFTGPPTLVLLLWGGADADGRPFLNPAFVVDARASLADAAGEWQIAGEAEDGRILFGRRLALTEVADGDGRSSFVFALPTEAGWADALARIVLTGPRGSAELDATSGPAAALLLDTSTGRVRGILRDWPDSEAAQSDVAWAAPEPGLEVQVSRGVPTPTAWRR